MGSGLILTQPSFASPPTPIRLQGSPFLFMECPAKMPARCHAPSPLSPEPEQRRARLPPETEGWGRSAHGGRGSERPDPCPHTSAPCTGCSGHWSQGSLTVPSHVSCGLPAAPASLTGPAPATPRGKGSILAGLASGRNPSAPPHVWWVRATKHCRSRLVGRGAGRPRTGHSRHKTRGDGRPGHRGPPEL